VSFASLIVAAVIAFTFMLMAYAIRSPAPFQYVVGRAPTGRRDAVGGTILLGLVLLAALVLATTIASRV
jgi:hypothetical protein